MIDGEITSCVSEERFLRQKNSEIYPLNAIESVLSINGLSPADLDWVVMSGEQFDPISVLCQKYSNFSVADRIREQNEYWKPKLLSNTLVNFLDVFSDKLNTKQYPKNWESVLQFIRNNPKGNHTSFFQNFRRLTVRQHLGIAPEKIIFVHHHKAHAYYAYYANPMQRDKTVILTADAWGDDMNASVSLAHNGRIELLSTSQNFMVGRLYRYITLLLGMKPEEHEYKVMGLAGYANSRTFDPIVDIFKSTMAVQGIEFVYNEKPSDLYFYFKEKLEGYRFDAIAGGLQSYTEQILCEWAKNALSLTSAKRLCFGGGVAMNIKAVMEISKLPSLEELFICPSPGDESLAMGAAYVAMHDICLSQKINPEHVLKPIKNAYLGPTEPKDKIYKTVQLAQSKGYDVQSDPSVDLIAKLLAQGKIVGRCMGSSEFGARALGNRSILADPRNSNIIKIINQKIKSRDFWMPFCPSILAEHADKYIQNPKNLKSPYMTMAFETTPMAQKQIPATLHPADLTTRPQLVFRNTNPEYYDLIQAFYRETNISALLNTSFNVHGEPIVQTSQDAFSVFERTELDAILLDGYLITRKN